MWHWTVPRALVLTFELVSSVCDEYTRQCLSYAQLKVILFVVWSWISFFSDNDFLWVVHLFHYNSVRIILSHATWHHSLKFCRWQSSAEVQTVCLENPKNGFNDCSLVHLVFFYIRVNNLYSFFQNKNHQYFYRGHSNCYPVASPNVNQQLG